MSAWAYVCHKDGKLGGVAAASLPAKELRKFLGEFAAEGFLITTVEDRDEYDKLTAAMPMWNSKPTC